MPVRGTSQWAHAIHQKKVINHDRGGTYVMCAWDTCERAGYQNNRVVTHEGAQGNVKDITYVFCSDRHKQYWLHSATGDINNLPAGFKNSIL